MPFLRRQLPTAAAPGLMLLTALLLLILAVAASVWLVERQRRDNQAVRASFVMQGLIAEARVALRDAETGQRGYLLTGEESYLEPYIRANSVLDEAFARLAEETADDPVQRDAMARVRRLVERKRGEMDQTVALYRNGRINEAMLIIQTDVGKDLMDDVRNAFSSVVAEEDRRLQERLESADTIGARLRIVVFGAAALLVLVMGFLLSAARRAIRELTEARDAAEAANKRLLREMAERESAEAQVRQMQKMEAIGQLTGGVAHDFNNMLAVITSSLNLMQRRLDRGEQDIAQFIAAAKDAAARAATLTSRLLAFSRKSALNPSVIDANKLVDGMSDLLRRTIGEHVQMQTVLAEGLWRSFADADQLENALVNLCVNARDGMPEGGKLTIETANIDLHETDAASSGDVAPGEYVMIAVTDSGIGMSSEVIAKAFDPFFTTKPVGKGTGLGLSQVHGFLKQSGGHVAISSELGAGTTVRMYLPRSEQIADTAAASEPPSAPMAADPAVTVLVVEDDARVRMLSVAALREIGYRVLHADNGAAALALLAAHADIALLFTDIVMPDMNGRKLADEARARNARLKVLFTTGYTQDAVVHDGVIDADARLLMKPYSLEALALKVRAVLDEV